MPTNPKMISINGNAFAFVVNTIIEKMIAAIGRLLAVARVLCFFICFLLWLMMKFVCEAGLSLLKK